MTDHAPIQTERLRLTVLRARQRAGHRTASATGRSRSSLRDTGEIIGAGGNQRHRSGTWILGLVDQGARLDPSDGVVRLAYTDRPLDDAVFPPL